MRGPIGVLSLMPLVNFSKLLTPDGQGEAACDLLDRAAWQWEKTESDGHTVDLSVVTSPEAEHRQGCQELWVTLLADGAPTLTCISRWRPKPWPGKAASAIGSSTAARSKSWPLRNKGKTSRPLT
ncbi:hypothetical protein ACWGRF_04100 [Streptomyces zhihengii]